MFFYGSKEELRENRLNVEFLLRFLDKLFTLLVECFIMKEVSIAVFSGQFFNIYDARGDKVIDDCQFISLSVLASIWENVQDFNVSVSLFEFNEGAIQHKSEQRTTATVERTTAFFSKCWFHPFIAVSYREDCYTCKTQGKCCEFCLNVAHILNYKAFKVCVKKVPSVNRRHLVPLGHFFTWSNCSVLF